MILKTNCKFCGEEIKVRGTVSDRAELSFKKGNRLKLTCKKCLKVESYHPNEINAKKSKIAMIVWVLVLILGITLIYNGIGNFYGEHSEYIENKSFRSFARLFGLLVIPIIIFQLINASENRKISRFNNYKVKGKD